MKNIITISFIIIGTIIGAGFASGKEIFTFFNIYGFYGLIGIFVSNILISIIIYKGMKLIKIKNIDSYESFISVLIGEKKYLNNIIKYIVNIFLIISFFVMSAGFSSYLKQECNIPNFYGAIVISVLNICILKKGIQGIKSINNILIPILIALIFIIGINNIEFKPLETTNLTNMWIIKSVLYSCYNTIMIFPILITLVKQMKKNNEIKLVTLFVFVIFLALSLVVFLLLNTNFDDVKNLEIPMGYITKGYKNIFCVLILGAIVTSVTSICYSFLQNLKTSKKTYNVLLIIMSCCNMIFCFVGFGRLVEILYPLLGALGIIQIFLLLKT